jgi:hypothetical protein
VADEPGVTFSFDGPLFSWRGPAPYFFVRVPPDLVEELADVAAEVTYGWGMVPVEVRLDRYVWETSLWPKDGGYLVPVRAEVRRALGLEADDVVAVRLAVAPRTDRPVDPRTGAPRRTRVRVREVEDG